MGEIVELTHSGEQAVAQVVTPVVETESKLTAPLIAHEGRVTRVEERQAQLQEENARALAGLEERLVSATGSQVGALEHRIASLEERMTADAQEDAPEVPDESVELTLPDVEASPAPPEKLRQGLRHRRKARRKGKE